MKRRVLAMAIAVIWVFVAAGACAFGLNSPKVTSQATAPIATTSVPCRPGGLIIQQYFSDKVTYTAGALGLKDWVQPGDRVLLTDGKTGARFQAIVGPTMYRADNGGAWVFFKNITPIAPGPWLPDNGAAYIQFK